LSRAAGVAAFAADAGRAARWASSTFGLSGTRLVQPTTLGTARFGAGASRVIVFAGALSRLAAGAIIQS
jgi:hypothetical protein